MMERCSECGKRIVFDGCEYVCEGCGRVFEEKLPPSNEAKPYIVRSRRSSRLAGVVKGVCDRLGLNETVFRDALHIIDSVSASGGRFNGLELAFFSLYVACRRHNPISCEAVLREFRGMGLKVGERNCMRVLSRFWKHYSYSGLNISSYVNFMVERLRSNIFVKEYLDNFTPFNENIVWSKVKAGSIGLLSSSRLTGETVRVRAAAAVYLSCEKVFRSLGLENPVTLKLLSKSFLLDVNNLRKAVGRIMVCSYEGLAQM